MIALIGTQTAHDGPARREGGPGRPGTAQDGPTARGRGGVAETSRSDVPAYSDSVRLRLLVGRQNGDEE